MKRCFPPCFPPALVLAMCAMLGGGCGSTPEAAYPSDQGALSPFELEDQEGRVHRYAGYSELPMVIAVCDPHSVESNIAWDHWLTDRYGDKIITYRVIDLTQVPGLLAPIVRSKIRAGADPPDLPILMDWEGFFASLVTLSEEHSTVIVADRKGAITLVVRGTPGKELQEQVAGELARQEGGDHGE